VYFYETEALTSHKNINQGIFENILKNTEKNPLAIQTSMGEKKSQKFPT
jgi:hypothetical protein